MVTPNEVVILKNVKDNASYDTIINHTVNTWQPNRSLQEISQNTRQGKLAEIAVERHLSQQDILTYRSYDDFRIDNFYKHAPLDGLLYIEGYRFIERDIDILNAEISANQYNKIPVTTRQYLRNKGVFTVEIKSTRISDKKKQEGQGDINKLISSIQRNHFLTYPYFLRYSKDIENFEQYKQYVKDQYDIDSNQLMDIEQNNIADIFIHCYVDDDTVYIMGYLPSRFFFIDPCIQRFYLKDKSEYALYYSYPLKDGFPIHTLVRNLRGVIPGE